MPAPLSKAVDRLPETYARALRLEAAGATHAEIATDLGIDVLAIDTLLSVARAKLASAEHQQEATS